MHFGPGPLSIWGLCFLFFVCLGFWAGSGQGSIWVLSRVLRKPLATSTNAVNPPPPPDLQGRDLRLGRAMRDAIFRIIRELCEVLLELVGLSLNPKP